VLTGDQILLLQDIVLRVPVADHVYAYAKKIVRCTRPAQPRRPIHQELDQLGRRPARQPESDPGGKARAILNGQFHVACEDIEAVAPSIMRHRLACNFTAQAEGITTDKVIEKLLQSIPKTEKLAAATK